MQQLGDTILVDDGHAYWEIRNDTVTSNGEALKELDHVLW